MKKLHSKIKLFGLAIFGFRMPDQKHILLYINYLGSDPVFTDVSGKALIF